MWAGKFGKLIRDARSQRTFACIKSLFCWADSASNFYISLKIG